MRPKHYLKNFLILLPFICGMQLLNGRLWLKVIPGFFAFCFLSSVIYIMNDIKDKEKDANHPTKCKRPVASGIVSVKSAIIFAVILLILTVGFNILTFSHWTSWLILGGYFLINLGYSLGLKNVPILDIALLASGFLLRLLYGSCITGIEISSWLYLTVLAFSLCLSLGKRRNELFKMETSENETRKVLKYYKKTFLDKFMYVCLTITIIFYSLWCVDPLTVEKLGNRIIWTIPFVILICMKYSLDIEGDSDGDPVNVLFKDKILLIGVVIFAVSFGLIIYL